MSQFWRNCDLPVSDGPTNDIKMEFFVAINMFIILVVVKCTQFHYAEIPSKQVIRHKFSKDEFPKSNQR